MKRPIVAPGVDDPAKVEPDAKFLKRFPLLHSYMVDVKYDDGTPRITSALSLFIEDGKWKAALNDRDLKRSAYVAGDGMDDVLGRLESGLVKEVLDWRAWGKNTRKK